MIAYKENYLTKHFFLSIINSKKMKEKETKPQGCSFFKNNEICIPIGYNLPLENLIYSEANTAKDIQCHPPLFPYCSGMDFCLQ